MNLHEQNKINSTSRRTVVKGAAWSVPVIAAAIAAPIASASDPVCVVPVGNSLKFNATTYSVPGGWDGIFTGASSGVTDEPMMKTSNLRNVTSTTSVTNDGAINYAPGEFTVTYWLDAWSDLAAGEMVFTDFTNHSSTEWTLVSSPIIQAASGYWNWEITLTYNLALLVGQTTTNISFERIANIPRPFYTGKDEAGKTVQAYIRDAGSITTEFCNETQELQIGWLVDADGKNFWLGQDPAPYTEVWGLAQLT